MVKRGGGGKGASRGGEGGGGACTDENIVFRCDSDKNSLVIIYMF